MRSRYRIFVLIIVFGFLFSLYSITRHLRLESFIYDLGFYDQLIWLASRFKPLFLSIQEYHAWQGHFNPSLVLLAPIFWIWNNVIALLIFQSFWAAFGAYPIYKLAFKRLKDVNWALFFGFLYLTYFGLTNAVAYDFHPLTVAVPLLAFIFWFYENKQFRLFWITLILFSFLQENFWLLSSSLGIFLIFKYRDWKRGLPIFVGSGVIYLMVVFWIVPTVAGSTYIFFPYELLNPLEGDKVYLVFITLLSFAFLPVLSPVFFILLGEEWLSRFIAAPGANYWSFGYHYNAMLAPTLVFASIETFSKFFRKQKVLIGWLLLLGWGISTAVVKPDILRMLDLNYFKLDRYNQAKKIFALIPNNASVAASNNLGPHLTHRENLIFLTNCRDNPQEWVWQTKRCYKTKPEYIVADLVPSVGNNLWPDNSLEQISMYLKSLVDQGEFTLIAKEGSIHLYKSN